MKELNYASLEASKRLDDAGIKLLTEAYWHIPFDGGEAELMWDIFVVNLTCQNSCVIIPAPSMAEVWRELPLGSSINIGTEGFSRCFKYASPEIINTNPADALIDLLIWVRSNPELTGD